MGLNPKTKNCTLYQWSQPAIPRFNYLLKFLLGHDLDAVFRKTFFSLPALGSQQHGRPTGPLWGKKITPINLASRALRREMARRGSPVASGRMPPTSEACFVFFQVLFCFLWNLFFCYTLTFLFYTASFSYTSGYPWLSVQT